MVVTPILSVVLLVGTFERASSFSPRPTFANKCLLTPGFDDRRLRRHFAGISNIDWDDLERNEGGDDEDEEVVFLSIGSDDFLQIDPEKDEDEEELPLEPYEASHPEEFMKEEAGSLTLGPVTMQDWGAEYGKLRQRVADMESGDAQKPSTILFRLMTSETPNQAIGDFVRKANPEVVQAMSGAVNSLLGGLSSPAMGIETVVKATGERVAALCFQLQMTGYMFRNAEYVMALKNIMNIRGSATLQEYKNAFENLDSNHDGFISVEEVEELLTDVYDEAVPEFEVRSFMKFFDTNKDGKISWDEFEKGLGAMAADKAASAIRQVFGLPGAEGEVDDEKDEQDSSFEETVSGTIKIEGDNGQVIEVEAQDYIDELKREAQALKEALQVENGPSAPNQGLASSALGIGAQEPQDEVGGGIAEYIASRGGDVKSLTEGISPEIVETMRKLVDFVLDGGGAKPKQEDKSRIEMEIPGGALQQLALWQLVLGYKLREAEATGEYLKILD